MTGFLLAACLAGCLLRCVPWCLSGLGDCVASCGPVYRVSFPGVVVVFPEPVVQTDFSLLPAGLHCWKVFAVWFCRQPIASPYLYTNDRSLICTCCRCIIRVLFVRNHLFGVYFNLLVFLRLYLCYSYGMPGTLFVRISMYFDVVLFNVNNCLSSWKI